MLRLMRNGVRRFSGVVGAVIVLAGFAVLQVFGQAAPPAGQLKQIDPSEHLFKLGFKFQGAGSCAAAACHGAPVGAPAGGKYVNPSYTQWAAEATPEAPADPHHTSFRTLRKPKSAEIGKKLGIANVTTATQCVACHAISVPDNLKEAGLTIAEGVTCNGCHGPSGASVANPADKGWAVAHQAANWAKQQRAAHVGKHNELLKKTGFYDTNVLVERSQQCVSCHLSINPQMVAAGHPQPMFEMNWFSLTYPNRHWNDPTDKYFGARLWAAGQAAAFQAALHQLAERAADPAVAPAEVTAAYNQAIAHYLVFAPLFKPDVGGVPNADMNAAAAALIAASKGLADPAKRTDVAKNAQAAFAAAGKITAAVNQWQPTKDQVLKLVTAELAQPALAGLSQGFGIEQQRDSIFGLYKAFADSADAKKEDQDNVNFIGEKLFPLDPQNAPLHASKIPAAQHTAAVAEVKKKLGL